MMKRIRTYLVVVAVSVLGLATLVGVHRAAAATGAKKLLVVGVSYPDAPLPYSVEQMRDLVFDSPTSVAAFYREASSGQLNLSGKVVAPIMLPAPFSKNNCTDSIDSTVFDLVRRAGVDPSNFQYFMWIRDACGSNATRAAQVRGLNFGAAVHELGHVFGLLHANGLRCAADGDPVPRSQRCQSIAYGDPFDPMGTNEGVGATHHFSAAHQMMLGWLPGARIKLASDTVTNVKLLSDEQVGTTGIQAVRIPIRTDPTTGQILDSYWLDVRQPSGTFESIQATDPIVNGVSIHTDELMTGGTANLIDAHPGTGTFDDAAFGVGETFTDARNGVQVTVRSIDTASSVHSAVVDVVRFTPARPTVSVDGLGVLRYDAPAGLQDDVTMTQLAGLNKVDVHDSAAPVAIGNNCVRINTSDARCSGVNQIVTNLGDLDDSNVFNGSLIDTVNGGDGNDALNGGAGPDVLVGGPGNNIFEANSTANDGGDVILGGPGHDTVSYAHRTNPIVATLNDNKANDGERGEHDMLASGIDEVDGGTADDILIGSSLSETFKGGRGSDVMIGYGGADTFIGGTDPSGNDEDVVWYADRGPTQGINASLDDVANDGTPGEGDNISSDVEEIIGGGGNDTFATSSSNVFGATFVGGGGDDSFVDASRGDYKLTGDTFIGGDGFDTVDYSARTKPVWAQVGGSGGEFGEGDTLDATVESIVGGSGNDVLAGANAGNSNALYGNAGNDRIFASDGGSDFIDGGTGNDNIQSRNGAFDIVVCGVGTDRAQVDVAPVHDAVAGCETLDP